MVISKDVDLPEFTTLTVPEVNLSTSSLMSAAPYLGKDCEAINNEFMLCRQELNDPRACVELGKKVTACSMQLFRKIKQNCLDEFNQYSKCIEKSSGDCSFSKCRKTQMVFDECMEDKVRLVRPEYGYFCRARVHKCRSGAPPAPACPCAPAVPDPTPALPDCKPRPAARFTSRFYWMTE